MATKQIKKEKAAKITEVYRENYRKGNFYEGDRKILADLIMVNTITIDVQANGINSDGTNFIQFKLNNIKSTK
jgi:hypothetical protein